MKIYVLIKLILTILLTIIFFSSVIAQEEEFIGFAKGDNYVSGFLSYSPEIEESDVSGYDFSFSPIIGFLITDHLALEALLMYTKSVEENDYSSSESKVYGMGVGANYYFTPINKFSFTMAMNISYYKEEGNPYGRNIDATVFHECKIIPGVSYFLSDSFLLKASLGSVKYSSNKEEDDDEKVNEELNINFNLSNINFGLSYRF